MPDPSQIKFDAAFSDTCVLFDHILNQDDGAANEILTEHESENVVSNTVKREFDGVKERRSKLIKSIIKSHKTDQLDDWEPPSSLNLSGNDYEFCEDTFSDLREMRSDSEIIQYLSEKERQFQAGEESLFDEPDAVIDTIWSGSRSAALLGSLRACVGNDNDRKVIADAADWASEKTMNSLITADQDDIISARERVEEHIERDRDVGELFILSKDQFLDLDPNYTRN
ncbi:hypothetical protein EXE43_14805 [Halorubrum sp. SS5]|nr:hypothetical protein EXE43_14805 [Halorubrum sp. SS5]